MAVASPPCWSIATKADRCENSNSARRMAGCSAMAIPTYGRILVPNATGAFWPERHLRQIAFAAMPNAILRFHLRHLEQGNEYFEVMAPRQPGEVGDVLRDVGQSLIRPAVPRRIIGS